MGKVLSEMGAHSRRDRETVKKARFSAQSKQSRQPEKAPFAAASWSFFPDFALNVAYSRFSPERLAEVR
ncbi:hypothetical protein [Pelagicoccus sp. SDUM812003]|uniref:hypothetical protein n=1 Tax=Pelagicoccus sp. SDUM812003 TaxID=3041267 RepID=UPI00280E9EE5|nr:hypothetical protein [Pelagicoccus sp. SDUM812003]MDQ8204086.1 hypothetical protein [Pelagicoccus sp. SDUM812003]